MTEISVKTVDFVHELLAHRAINLKLAPLPAFSPNIIAFTGGLPDLETLPAQELGEAAVAVMRDQYTAALQYGHPVPLVEYLVKFIQSDQGFTLTKENILVTAGSFQALSLVCRLLIDPGDVIVVEAPTFPGAVAVFRKAEAEIVEVPLDDEGLNIEALDDVLSKLEVAGKRVKFIYTIPTFQNPTGLTLSLERRFKLLEVAARHRVLILEDDAYHGLLYEGEVPPWLWTLDDRGLVLHCGTLSKTLATGIRLGWVGGPANLIALITALKDDGGTSPFAGYIAAQYAQNGRLEQHTKTLIELYGRKRDRMLAGLERYMPQGVRWTHPQGGFFIWLELPRGLDTGKFLSKALAAGVSYVPGARCFASGSGQNCIRLSFSFVKLDQIELGIHILAEVIKAELESYSY